MALKCSQIIPRAITRIDSCDWGNIPSAKAYWWSVMTTSHAERAKQKAPTSRPADSSVGQLR
jgi:hypothetical protein